MKICPKCNMNVSDDAVFCTSCGSRIEAASNEQPYIYTPVFDPTDHTAEFDPKDISENKVVSMLVYLMGIIGIFIALLAANTSKYAGFHVRQALKFIVVEALLAIIAAVTFWTLIVPFACGVAMLVLLVIKIICFFQICAGKAKEPPIISSLTFLK